MYQIPIYFSFCLLNKHFCSCKSDSIFTWNQQVRGNEGKISQSREQWEAQKHHIIPT